MAEPALFIIDTMNQVYRAHYAIRQLSTSGNFPTNAIFGVAAMINKLIKTWRPSHLVAAAEGAGPTFRHERFPAYKANRAKTPDELLLQLPHIFEFLSAMGIPVLQRNGLEADDIIATLVRDAREKGFQITIVSSDKDLFQMVEPGVAMLDTKSDVLYDAGQVFGKLGVRPDQVVDFLALMGDASDNVPGAPGIGEKTAATLLSRFGSLDACLEHLDEVTPPRVREILRQYRQQVLEARELVRLAPQPGFDWPWADFQLNPPDLARLRELFTRFEFKSLLDEITIAPPPVSTGWHVQAGLAGLREHLGRPPEVPLAMLPGERGSIWLLPEGGHTLLRIPANERRALQEELAAATRRYYQFKELCSEAPLSVPEAARVEDLALLHYLIYPHQENHSLERIALDTTGSPLPPPAAPADLLTATEEDAATRVDATARRLEVIHQACASLGPKLAGLGLEKVYREMELPLAPILAQMEQNGILIDVPYLLRLSRELAGRIHDLEEDIYLRAETRFNINSPKQLGEILFEKMGLKPLRKTKKTKSYSTGVEVLEELALEFEFPARILDYRQLSKLKSTYVDALPPLVRPSTGRLHTTFHQTVAATGRLSSANPNLQNIPIRTGEGQKIRRAFVAPPGWRLISADYSQIELRLMACLSQDQALIDAFHSGMDIHTKTALDVFGEAAAANPAEYRRRAKIINYSILYGVSDYGLSRDLKTGVLEAQQFIGSYFEAYPGVRRWIDGNLAQARRDGRVCTMFGRIRPMPELTASDHNIQKMGERIATNAPVQGSAADIIKLAMIRLDAALRSKGSPARLLLQVHDELVLECPEAAVGEVGSLVREAMEGVAELPVPLTVDVHDGPNWLEAK